MILWYTTLISTHVRFHSVLFLDYTFGLNCSVTNILSTQASPSQTQGSTGVDSRSMRYIEMSYS